MDETYDNIYRRAMWQPANSRPNLWPRSTSEMGQYVEYGKGTMTSSMNDTNTYDKRIPFSGMPDQYLINYANYGYRQR